MARARVLNPTATAARPDALALSQEMVAAAREIRGPGECAPLDGLAAQLHGVTPERMASDAARIAFWANIYNALVHHCLCLKPVRGNLLRHLRMFDRVAYRVGGHDYAPNLIENGVLRGNRRPPLRLRRPLRAGDPRLAAAPSRLDPRIHFALNCGARSCPPVRVYDPETLDAQLELATRAYLEAEVTIDARRRRVILPRLMRLYRRDFGDRAGQLEFAARYLPEVRRRLGGDLGMAVGYGRFDWTVATSR